MQHGLVWTRLAPRENEWVSARWETRYGSTCLKFSIIDEYPP